MCIRDRVYAVGHPLGLVGSLSAGVVSATGRSLTTKAGVKLGDLIQYDAAVNPGTVSYTHLDVYKRQVPTGLGVLPCLLRGRLPLGPPGRVADRAGTHRVSVGVACPRRVPTPGAHAGSATTRAWRRYTLYRPVTAPAPGLGRRPRWASTTSRPRRSAPSWKTPTSWRSLSLIHI